MVKDQDRDSFQIGGASPIIIPAGGHKVFGRSADPQVNGNVAVDYVYPGMVLANYADEIILMAGDTEVDRVEYDNSAG